MSYNELHFGSRLAGQSHPTFWLSGVFRIGLGLCALGKQWFPSACCAKLEALAPLGCCTPPSLTVFHSHRVTVVTQPLQARQGPQSLSILGHCGHSQWAALTKPLPHPPAGEDYGRGGGVTGDPCLVRCPQAGERTGKSATGTLCQAAPTAFQLVLTLLSSWMTSLVAHNLRVLGPPNARLLRGQASACCLSGLRGSAWLVEALRLHGVGRTAQGEWISHPSNCSPTGLLPAPCGGSSCPLLEAQEKGKTQSVHSLNQPFRAQAEKQVDASPQASLALPAQMEGHRGRQRPPPAHQGPDVCCTEKRHADRTWVFNSFY